MKQRFANEMAFLSLGATAGCVMTDCEKYGMCYGCDEHCPVLIAGKCENEDSIRMYYHLTFKARSPLPLGGGSSLEE